MSEAAQRGVTKAANIRRIAVDGATLLTGFYHRSVLRCGCLAERKSGVADILSAPRASENISVGLSRIEYPRQPGARKSQSKRAVNNFQILASDCNDNLHVGNFKHPTARLKAGATRL
jgi:hypothetical protein